MARANAPDVNALLNRKSFLDHWTAEATRHCETYGWACELVPATRRTLEATFGPEWLEAEATKLQRNPIAGDAKKHPLGLLIEAPSASSVAKTLELGKYLRRCARLPRLDEVVDHLRSATQYSRGRFQLALAFRLLRAGILESDLELEPDADGGRKSDIGFITDSKRYLMECYEPTPDRHHEIEMLIGPTAQRCFEIAKSVGKRVVLRAHIKRPDLFDTAARKRAESASRQLIERVAAHSHTASSEDAFDLEVFDTSGSSAADVQALAWSLTGDVRPAWLVNAALVDRVSVPDLARGEHVERTRLSWVVVTASEPRNHDEEDQRLVDAIERKLPQVRHEATKALGIVAVKTGRARSAARREASARALVERIGRKVLERHKCLAGVFLVDDAIGKDNVPVHGGLFIGTATGEALSPLFERVQRDEERGDLLTSTS
jgi:hypothetical protein